jgi:uncharacterized membrane protein
MSRLAMLTVLSDRHFVAEGVFAVAGHAGVDAEDLLRESVAQGRYTVAEFREILDEIEG